MKVFKIIQLIGYIAILLASVFALVNSIAERFFFNEILILCLFILGIVIEIVSIVVSTYISRKK